jgi:hypothetical protein
VGFDRDTHELMVKRGVGWGKGGQVGVSGFHTWVSSVWVRKSNKG